HRYIATSLHRYSDNPGPIPLPHHQRIRRNRIYSGQQIFRWFSCPEGGQVEGNQEKISEVIGG
ncbi:hypothetical protein, partial [Acidithiobacillus ferrianus]|uniref:hypothetical protein n=1 Tax=Acidithiobacillus ferrianus TaxID=2678518 RepID=UPI0034E4B2F0